MNSIENPTKSIENHHFFSRNASNSAIRGHFPAASPAFGRLYASYKGFLADFARNEMVAGIDVENKREAATEEVVDTRWQTWAARWHDKRPLLRASYSHKQL